MFHVTLLQKKIYIFHQSKTETRKKRALILADVSIRHVKLLFSVLISLPKTLRFWRISLQAHDSIPMANANAKWFAKQTDGETLDFQ